MRTRAFIRTALSNLTTFASVAASVFAADASAGTRERWCNPLPLPNYPVGRLVRDVAAGAPADSNGLWLVEQKQQYRELADPSAVWFENKWYLYPSCDMAWVSEDEGRTWQHHPLNVRDVGYAPTVVRHAGRFLLLASGSDLYAGPTPLGPFACLGGLEMPDIKGMPNQTDPMLFSDDDGRLYYYWGCTPSGGIWGVELDSAHPRRVIGEPRELIPFQPDTQPWERVGNRNQNPNVGWMEGGWMFKHRGRYYLTYSAGGTQYRTYAMGCAVSDSPLGTFVHQKRNPIFRTTEGLVTGTAHGCVVAGPRDQAWVFYTVFAGVAHGFERRLGMDLATIDDLGELHVPAATSTPQPLPVNTPSPQWLPLNDGQPTFGSSSAANLGGRLAADNAMITWWQPAENDARPTLTTHFSAPAVIRAVRVIWRDVGLDTVRGITPGPFRYRIEAETEPGVWTPIVDRSANADDLLIDYRECSPTTAPRARLVILGQPAGISPAVAEFTVFGTAVAE